jgi:hypothetical protein
MKRKPKPASLLKNRIREVKKVTARKAAKEARAKEEAVRKIVEMEAELDAPGPYGT